MELVHLRTFLAVVEHRGFRNAARRLYLSQPAVSRQVAELERSVGVPLLERTPGGVEPTAAGLVLAEQAQHLLEDSREALRRARLEPLTGNLVVGIAPGGAGELTGPLLRHLVRALPGVRIRTYDFTMLTWSDAPPAGTDLLLTRDPYSDERVRQTVLLTERAVAALPRHLPEADAPRLTLEQFLALPYARISRRVPSAFTRFWTLEADRRGLGADFRGRPALQPSDAPRAVLRGDGCAMGSTLTARLYGRPSLPLIPVQGAPSVRVALVSAIGDRRPVVDAVHREVGWATRRLGPLVLPELAEPLPV